MGLWIGIDGGGSKTLFLGAEENGSAVRTWLGPGTDYHSVGTATVCKVLTYGVQEVLRQSGRERPDGICFAMPTYGEGGTEDVHAAEQIRRALAPFPLRIVNDSQAGWAGSLALEPGVNIVAGTGSIAFGRDARGATARCGGWAEFFSDEGSGYWLGRRALELFSKQSDGRAPRGPLYDLMRQAFSLKSDMDLNTLIRREYAPSRERTASLQRLLETAARAGDTGARDLYAQAGQELALIVNGVMDKLTFDGPPAVSYSGGVFRTGELLLAPFRGALSRQVRLTQPLLSPACGAALLAAEQFSPAGPDTLRLTLLQSERQSGL